MIWLCTKRLHRIFSPSSTTKKAVHVDTVLNPFLESRKLDTIDAKNKGRQTTYRIKWLSYFQMRPPFATGNLHVRFQLETEIPFGNVFTLHRLRNSHVAIHYCVFIVVIESWLEFISALPFAINFRFVEIIKRGRLKSKIKIDELAPLQIEKIISDLIKRSSNLA